MDVMLTRVTQFLDHLSRRRFMRYSVSAASFVSLGVLHHVNALDLQWSATLPVASVLIGAATGFLPTLLSTTGLTMWGWLDHARIVSGEQLFWTALLSGLGGWINHLWRRNDQMLRSVDQQAVKYQKLSTELQDRVNADMAKLRKNEEIFRVLIEGVKEYAIIMLDKDGSIMTWNSGAERIKGWTSSEIIGQHYELFYPPERRVAGDPIRALTQAREEGQFRDRGYRVRRDGTRFIAEATLTALRGHDGEFCGYAKITRDVTEIEETRANSAQNERAAALGRLAAGVAHDFNNVLQVITVNAEMIHEKHADAVVIRRCATRLIQASKRGAAISSRLLEFARHDDYNPDGWHIKPVFDAISDLLSPLLPSSIAIKTFAENGLPAVTGQVSQFETVITNLATNARDAMPQGGTISLSATVATLGKENDLNVQAGQYVRVSVTDNGKGMDAQTLAQVAQPFFTTKPRGHGTGLGLPLAKKFAEDCGGTLSIASTVGQFTEISLWLPVALQNSDIDVSIEKTVDDRSAVGIVMVVDDDDLVRETIMMTLCRRGFTPIGVSNGHEAMAILQDRSRVIDALLVDHGLPDISGSVVIQEAMRLRPDLRALMVTGNIGEMRSMEGDSNPVGLLRKPFSPTQLFDAVSGLLRAVPETA